MCKVLCYLSPSVTLNPPFSLWLLLTYLISVTHQVSYQVCRFLYGSPLITHADKLLHSQEMNLQSALHSRIEPPRHDLHFCWRVFWFLHYLHSVKWRVCVMFAVSVCVCVAGWSSNYSISSLVVQKWYLFQNIFPSSKGSLLIIGHGDSVSGFKE